MDSADEFRAEAARCRLLAQGARDPVIARNLKALADELDAEAERLETGPESQPPMPQPD